MLTHLRSIQLHVLFVIILTRLSIFGILYAPAAIGGLILEDLDITMSQFGLAISIPNGMIIASGLLGSLFVDSLGVRRALIAGLLVLGFGGSGIYFVSSFPQFVFTRILQGVGAAITFPVTGALIMESFSSSQRPYVNTAVSVCAHGGLGIAWAVSFALADQLGQSWTAIVAVYGVIVLAVMISWVFWGKNPFIAPTADSLKGKSPALDASRRYAGSLSSAVRMRVVWRLTIGIFANSWVFSMYLTFLPLYFDDYDKKLPSSQASYIASFLLFSGAMGVLILGFLSRKPHLRKRLLWVSGVIVAVGSSALIFGEHTLLYLGLVLTGFGLSGVMPVFFTYLMSLPRMTPPLVAASLVMANIAVYSASFISPFLAGILADSALGFKYSMALLSGMELVAIIMFWQLPKEN